MQFDLEGFPLVWLRDHAGTHEHDDQADREILLGLLKRGERFVVILERAPGLQDLSDTSQDDRKQRARLFKVHKKEIVRLCAGMILVGRPSSLPLPIQKVIAGVTSAIGIAVLFAATAQAATELARTLLDHRPSAAT